MDTLELAGRYGRSVFELSEQAGLSRTIFEELRAVGQAMEQRPELLYLLKSPLITLTEKCSLVDGILGPKASPLAREFLNLLVEKNRLDSFPLIVVQLRHLMNEKDGIQEATVVTARELHPSILELVAKALEARSKKKMLIQTKTDRLLLGGIQIRMGNRLIDGTIRTQLNSLEARLKNVKG